MRNEITIHGYLGRDPELKEYKNAKGEAGKYCTFSVGVSRDNDDNTDWFNCIIFGKRAEVVDKWFHKGSQIIAWGRMQSDKYKDKDGNERIGWKMVVNGFDFCDSKGGKKEDGNDIPDNFKEQEEDIPF